MTNIPDYCQFILTVPFKFISLQKKLLVWWVFIHFWFERIITFQKLLIIPPIMLVNRASIKLDITPVYQIQIFITNFFSNCGEWCISITWKSSVYLHLDCRYKNLPKSLKIYYLVWRMNVLLIFYIPRIRGYDHLIYTELQFLFFVFDTAL